MFSNRQRTIFRQHPGGVGIPGDIEPVPSPAFAVMRTGEQSLDHSFTGPRIAVCQKRLHFRGSGRQAEQIERRLPQQNIRCRFVRQRQTLGFEGRADECSLADVFWQCLCERAETLEFCRSDQNEGVGPTNRRVRQVYQDTGTGCPAGDRFRSFTGGVVPLSPAGFRRDPHSASSKRVTSAVHPV